MTRHYPDLGGASYWLNQISHAARPIRSTTQIWVMTCHQYGISALVSQTSFGGEISGSASKCRLFSQASLPWEFSVSKDGVWQDSKSWHGVHVGGNVQTSKTLLSFSDTSNWFIVFTYKHRRSVTASHVWDANSTFSNYSSTTITAQNLLNFVRFINEYRNKCMPIIVRTSYVGILSWTYLQMNRLHLVVKIMHKLFLKYCLVLKVQACTSNSFRAFYDIVLPGFFPCQLIAIENQNQLFTTSQRLIQKNCIVQLELKLKFVVIDICCVGNGVKYHSPSYWSIFMTSPVEFSTGEFRAKQVRKVL